MSGHQWRAEECAGRAAHLQGPRSSRKKFTHLNRTIYSPVQRLPEPRQQTLHRAGSYLTPDLSLSSRASLPALILDPVASLAAPMLPLATTNIIAPNLMHPPAGNRGGGSCEPRHVTCRLHLTSWRGLAPRPAQFLLHPPLPIKQAESSSINSARNLASNHLFNFCI